MKQVFLIASLFICTEAFSTVTVGVEDCPIVFDGKVKEVISPVGASDFFSTNKVVFENLQKVKGQASEVVLVDILQNGPFKVEASKDYRVQLREGKLCWIEEI